MSDQVYQSSIASYDAKIESSNKNLKKLEDEYMKTLSDFRKKFEFLRSSYADEFDKKKQIQKQRNALAATLTKKAASNQDQFQSTVDNAKKDMKLSDARRNLEERRIAGRDDLEFQLGR